MLSMHTGVLTVTYVHNVHILPGTWPWGVRLPVYLCTGTCKT